MKIAAYLNEDGAVSGFHQPGRVVLFNRKFDRWVQENGVAVAIGGESPLAMLKRELARIAAAIAPCRRLITHPARGIAAAILQQDFGFHLWQSEGTVMEQLDHVVRRERDAAATARPAKAGGHGQGCAGPAPDGGGHRALPTAGPPPPMPEPIGPTAEGRFRFDLETALAARPDLNSRDLLVPILNAGAFRELVIHCDHPPRWMPPALAILGLAAEITGTETIGAPVVIRVAGPPPLAPGEIRRHRIVPMGGCCG